MRVLLSGYYGFGNLGDEALLAVIVERLNQRFAHPQIEVLSATPLATAAALSVTATPRWQWPAVRAAIERADVVLSGGGGLLQNATSLRSLFYYAGILRHASRAKRKSMIFAQSIGPLDAFGRFIVRRWCKGVERATVRDERSRTLLRELLPATPVERTADPVFLYDAPAEIDLSEEGLGPESGPYAIVSLRKVAHVRDAAGVVGRAVERLSRRYHVRSAFLPFGGAADAAVCADAIRASNSDAVLLPACSLPKAAAIVRGARVVIGMRLHALILAARYAVPFLAMAYDPKITALCDDLEYPLAPLWESSRPAPSDAAVDDLVDMLMLQRDRLATQLSARMKVVRAAAERNFDVLGELLGEGS